MASRVNRRRGVDAIEALEPRQLLAGVATSLSLTDMNGAALPQSTPGVYNLQAGTNFRVVLSATVTSPNKTNASRTTTALRNQPLGLGVLGADIRSSGKNIVNPVGEPGDTPPHWAELTDLTPNGFALPFTNLVDLDGDGDPDVAGTGFFNSGHSVTTTSQLSQYQYGAGLAGSATAGPMKLVSGEYKAIGGGTTKLTTSVTAANVYVDANPDVALTTVSVLQSAVNGSITINVTGGGGGGGNTASISGKVFSDNNKNGTFDSGDALLSNRKIFIDANENGKLDTGEKTATSNASGVYTFSNLAAGTYEIRRADTPAGYSFSVPASGFYDVTVTSGQAVGGKDFGAVLGTTGGGGGTGSISGTLFNDANKDGKFDSGDSALSNRKAFIDANKNGKLDSGEKTATTNSSGVYTFTGLAAGTYVVRRGDTPAGYSYTEPVGGAYTITLSAGQKVTGKDIGVVLGSVSAGGAASISGRVFNDSNKNGKFESGESLLSNRRIYIDKNKDGKFDIGDISVLSNSSGVYTFSGLAAGEYIIRRADTPSNYKITDPASGFYDIKVTAGQKVTGKDIGAALK